MSEIVKGAATAVVTISGHVTSRSNVTTTEAEIPEKATNNGNFVTNIIKLRRKLITKLQPDF